MCVIMYVNINGKKILVKNRDRTYKPKLKIIHEIINGLEIVYMLDTKTGWVEGMNENGFAAVNSTLSMSDIGTKRIKNKKHFMYDALINRTKEESFSELQKIEGNNLVSFEDSIYHIGNNKKKIIINRINSDVVYTNHLKKLNNAGLTTGRKGLSSFLRKKIIETELKSLKTNKFSCEDEMYETISTTLNKNYENVDPRFHPYRDKKFTIKKLNISPNQKFVNTTGQLILNVTDKHFVYYTDVNNSEKIEYVNLLPNNYKATIRVSIKETQKNVNPHTILSNKYLEKTYKKFNYNNAKTKKVYK